MKRKVLFIIALCVIPMLYAYDIEYDGIYYNITSSNTVEVTKCWCGELYEGDIIIPSSVCGYKVTSIEGMAFARCEEVTSIVIPNSIISIGDWAFKETGLTSVIIPNSVVYIGKNPFVHCQKLTTIVVKNGNTNYDSRDNCNAIIETSTNTIVASSTKSSIPNSVTRIGYGAFAGRNFTSFSIPNNIKEIEGGAFVQCAKLISITIPNSITKIGEEAFEECYDLTSITLSEKLACIPEKTFLGCRNLTSISIPNSVTTIGSLAFQGCQKLKSVKLPNGLKVIESEAFQGCISISSITLPNSLEEIGYGAFADCKRLTSITIPKGIKKMESNVFSGCIGITSVVWNVENYNNIGFNGWSFSPFSEIAKQITSFKFGENVQKIPASICEWMNKLVDITIPNSVTSIEKYAFKGCENLEEITLGTHVVRIGELAFTDYWTIDVISHAAVLPTIYENSFSGKENYESTLYVPANKISEYKANKYWNKFDIQAIKADSL